MNQVQLVHLDKEVKLDQEEKLVLQVHLEDKGSRVQLDLRDRLDQVDSQVLQDPEVKLGLGDRLEKGENLVLLAPQVRGANERSGEEGQDERRLGRPG